MKVGYSVQELGKLRKYFTPQQELEFQKGMKKYIESIQTKLKKEEAAFKNLNPTRLLDGQIKKH